MWCPDAAKARRVREGPRCVRGGFADHRSEAVTTSSKGVVSAVRFRASGYARD